MYGFAFIISFASDNCSVFESMTFHIDKIYGANQFQQKRVQFSNTFIAITGNIEISSIYS